MYVGRVQRLGRVAKLMLAAGFVVTVAASAIWLPPDVANANFGAAGTSACGFNNNSGPVPLTNCTTRANNGTHVVRFAGLGNGNGWTNIDDDLDWVIHNRLNPTDMTAYHSTHATNPDVWAMDNDYGNNLAIAWVDCPANASTGGSGTALWCRGQYLRFNSFYEGSADGRSLACEELGHTVGLRHNTHPDNFTYASCMGVSPTFGELTFYSGHETTDHINANY